MTKYLLIIIAFAAILRLIFIFNLPLSYDESFDIIISQNPNFLERSKAIIEGHPPLFFTILNLWQLLSPKLEFARLLSFTSAILTIPTIFYVASKLFNQKVAMFSAALMAISPSHIFYSSIARSYSLAILETILIIYFLIQFLKSKKQILPLAFFLILGIYTHYFFIIMFMLINFYFLLQRQISKKWLLLNIIIVSFCLPLIYLTVNTQNFLAPPHQSSFKLFVFYLTSYVPWDIIQNLKIYKSNILDLTSSFSIILMATSVLLFMASIIKTRKIKWAKLLIFTYILAPILVTFISYLVTPISALRSYVIFLPFYIFLLALFAAGLPNLKRRLLISILTGLSLIFLPGFIILHKEINAYGKIYKNLNPESVVLYNDVTLFLPNQILKPKGQHILIFRGHLRPETYQALKVEIIDVGNITKSSDIRYARLLTRWPQFEKEADQLENYLKKNYLEINRQKYPGWQLIYFTHLPSATI